MRRFLLFLLFRPQKNCVLTPLRLAVIPILASLLIGLTACSAGHLGSSEIAFVRDGHLWTSDPNGANAFEVAAQDTPIVGYTWSPTHQILAFRTLDEQFSKTLAARQLTTNTVTGQIADAPSVINTVGVDGGNAIPIMLSSPQVQYSNPMWNTAGTRLIYRQEPTASHIPLNALWWASQNDQPDGIAAKVLPSSESLLSLSYINSTAIGIDRRGLFTVPLVATGTHYLTSGSLPGHPLPAALERVLWQPRSAQPLLLYAESAPNKQSTGRFTGTLSMTRLVLRTQSGQEKLLASCDCTQFAWSPDGTMVLYSTGQQDTIVNVTTGSSFNFAVEGDSVPYWSPNSKFLLLDGSHALQIIEVASRQQHTLLNDGVPPNQGTIVAGVNALLQPVPNSLWDADSTRFIFLSRSRLNWQGYKLVSAKGLYTITVDTHGQPQGMPATVDTGNDTQAGWSFQDANTSFLY